MTDKNDSKQGSFGPSCCETGINQSYPFFSRADDPEPPKKKKKKKKKKNVVFARYEEKQDCGIQIQWLAKGCRMGVWGDKGSGGGNGQREGFGGEGNGCVCSSHTLKG